MKRSWPTSKFLTFGFFSIKNFTIFLIFQPRKMNWFCLGTHKKVENIQNAKSFSNLTRWKKIDLNSCPKDSFTSYFCDFVFCLPNPDFKQNGVKREKKSRTHQWPWPSESNVWIPRGARSRFLLGIAEI